MVTELQKRVGDWLLVQLQERNTITWKGIGLFTPTFVADYFLQSNPNEAIFLMPPSVQLSFCADEYLLAGENYTVALTRDTPLEVYLLPELLTALCDLYGYEESQVVALLRQYLTELLKLLFRGRRVSFFDLGDFYVTEESDNYLFLNFAPSPHTLKVLNHPFSSYSPVEISRQALPHNAEVCTTPVELSQQSAIITPLKHKTVLLKEEVLNRTASSREMEDAVFSGETIETPIASIYETTIEENTLADPILAQNGNKSFVYYLRWVPLLILPLIFYCWNLWYASIHPQTRILIPQDTLAVSSLSDSVAPNVSVNKEQTAIGGDSVTAGAVSQSRDKANTISSPMEKKHMPPTDLSRPLSSNPIEKVTDTITLGMSLAKLARKHYGQTKLWVYIYMQNKLLISDPNNIPLNTVLEIPDIISEFHLSSDTVRIIDEAILWEPVILKGQFTSYEEQKKEVCKDLHR